MTDRKTWPPVADTVITDPQTGLPVLTDVLIDNTPAKCRGDCRQGRIMPCPSPMMCGMIPPRRSVAPQQPADPDDDEWLAWCMAIGCIITVALVIAAARFLSRLPVVM